MKHFALVAAFVALPALATPLDSSFTETVIPTGGFLASGFVHLPDASGRTLVLDKNGGIVRVVQNGAYQVAPWASEAAPVNNTGECGLIGIAVDPGFFSNRYVYLFITKTASEQRIVRYSDVGGVGTNRTELITGLPTGGSVHNGGAVLIGPDGRLYWAIGDQGISVGANGDLTSLAAKISRARRDGTAPIDNPFWDGPGPNADFIWARGFRNPFSMTMQPTTGLLWVNVAGTDYETVDVPSAGSHSGWDLYEITQAPSFLRPRLWYRSNNPTIWAIAPVAAHGVVRVNNELSITTTLRQAFHVGQRLTIAGVSDASFNGDVTVNRILGPWTVGATQMGPNAVSGEGTATTQNIGGCVTGGTFYDSSRIPAAYRENFFFGDWKSGNIARVQLDSANVITAVDFFSRDNVRGIDTEVGLDGDLYHLRYSSEIVRLSYNGAQQGLAVTPLNKWLLEGTEGVVGVRLNAAPTGAMTVSAQVTGSPHVTIVGSSSLTFTSANWDRPQFFTLAAASDADDSTDVARLSVTSAALATESATVHVIDTTVDGRQLVLAPSVLTIAEGTNTGQLRIAFASAPVGNVTVRLARTAGDPDVTVLPPMLTFTPGNGTTPQLVTVLAAHDPDFVNDTATISASAPGLITRSAKVLVTDDEGVAPVITSMAVTTATVGQPYSYDVDATGSPAPTFLLDELQTGMSLAYVTGVLSWTPGVPGSFAVTVRAVNGVGGGAVQSFIVTVADVDGGAGGGASGGGPGGGTAGGSAGGVAGGSAGGVAGGSAGGAAAGSAGGAAGGIGGAATGGSVANDGDGATQRPCACVASGREPLLLLLALAGALRRHRRA